MSANSSVTPTPTATESVVTELAQGQIDTTETPARYLALLARIRPLLISSTRYLAYTSDVGEAFRPVINQKVVSGAYGVSWAYIVGDVAYEGYRGHLAAKGQPDETTVVGLKVAKRATFQATASMLFPALTIHSSVKYSKRFVFSKLSNPRLRSLGPTVLGLAIIPMLPSLFDEPCEHVVDQLFNRIEYKVLGRTVQEPTLDTATPPPMPPFPNVKGEL